MPPGIPDFARDAAQKYLGSFDRATAQRGEDYFARGAVRGILPLVDEIGCYAEVSGTQNYDVVATFNKKTKQWSCECDCPVEGRCKHCYAVM